MKLSIITINYNDLLGLKKTIESVVNQSYSDIEYIVIDGGSTDGSKEYIEQQRSNFSYWVSEEDNGIYNAMNKGIKIAKGEYLLFLNSGDWLVNNGIIEKLLKSVSTEDIVYGNIFKVNDKGEAIEKKGVASSNVRLSDLYYRSIFHPASILRRDLFEKYGYYDESLKIVSDWAFFLKGIYFEKVKVRYIDLAITYFVLDGISSKNQQLLKKNAQSLTIFRLSS